jgi:uncharacterized protein (DUF1697 family)
MEELRILLERLGHANVATLLQSGNVVLSGARGSSAQIGRKIETALEKEFGFEIGVVVRTQRELEVVVQNNPFPGAEKEPAKLLVTFFAQAPDGQRLAAMKPAEFLPEEFRVAGREIYLRLPNGAGRSKLFSAVGDRRLGGHPTARNWNTIQKLLELARSER